MLYFRFPIFNYTEHRQKLTSSIPFYRALPLDQKAYEFQAYGKIDLDGLVIDSKNQTLPYNINFDLDPQTIQSLQSLFCQTILAQGRSEALPLNTEVSIRDIAQSIREAAKKTIDEKITTIWTEVDFGDFLNLPFIASSPNGSETLSPLKISTK